MEVTITQFRKQLFTLVEQALNGTAEVWVTHKGRRFKITPEQPMSKLDRLTPMKIINEDVPESLAYEVMSKAWEKDWDELF
jgi:hypothetical protein